MRVFLAFVSPLLALLADSAAGQASLQAHATSVDGPLTVTTSIEGAEGQLFWVSAALPTEGEFDLGSSVLVGIGTLDPDGAGSLDMPVDTSGFPEDFLVDYRGVYLTDDGLVMITPPVGLPLSGSAGCELLDFDFTLGPDEPTAGEIIADQWELIGLTVSAVNGLLGHPDLAIIFDSASPTGGDDDLVTPGPGAGNDTALGNLLVVAENAFDGDKDGKVDVPDDEAFGGTIVFEFAARWTICSITLVDIDDSDPTELRFFKAGVVEPETISVSNMGDNSVQKVVFLQEDVVRFEVELGGSGGIADIEAIPCPFLVNFDETSFGAPLDLKAGQEMTTDFQNLGLTINVDNAVSGHPDKGILFDSENPTGGDFDLLTPGPGFGNDKPLGLVLIIAENDVDLDFDGLVDDPDDEQGGGTIDFVWDTDVFFVGATILDVDGSRMDFFNLYDSSDTLITSIPIAALGDNSVQTLSIEPAVPGVRRAELVLDGSGAVTRVRFCPQNED